jgi:ubiquitin carboxyl-terminal hydrolase 5/13
MDLLSTHVAGVRVPRGGDKVYKDECSFSFDTPESDGGLFVCLSTFLGFSREFVELHYRKTGHTLYLNIQRRRIEEPTVEKAEDAPPNKKPTKMALGIEGGFDLDEEPLATYEEENSIVILPSFTTIPLPCPDLPPKIQESVAGILAAESASKMEAIAAWEGEERFISKFSGTNRRTFNVLAKCFS